MDYESMSRRMARLKKRRTVQGKPDEFLELLLDDALDTFLDITHRESDPGERIDGLLCEMANFMSNLEGGEHMTQAQEGDLMKQSATGDLPDSLYKRIIAYRQVVGINAEYDL